MLVPLYRLLVAGFLSGTASLAQGTRPPARCATVADFVELEGRDTVSLSRIAFTDSTFESKSYVVSQGALARYAGRLDATGDVRTLHIEVWPRIADSAGPPAQIADVTVHGTDISARVAAPTRGVQLQHDRLPPGGVLYMSGAPIFLELLQRHVRLAVGSTGTVPALWLFTGGAVDTVRVAHPAPDSVTVRFAEVAYLLARAPDGSILSGLSRPKAGSTAAPSRFVRRDCR
jgi:hypothetical protein